MSNPADVRSPLVRFLDSFFQERNIKWMLAVGMLILFGSSVMLVTSRWETYTPAWKQLILLGYTASVFVVAQVCYWRLALRRTGTVLLSLTVLLIPVNFLALHHIGTHARSNPWEFILQAALLGLTCAGSGFAAMRIFAHFLRGHQPTFVVSYLLLALAGALVPDLPAAWSPAIAFCLWAIFTVGTVKVNRHVFWLTEEHRLPRIFGFFPIALLGTQFLSLVFVATNLTQVIPFQWLGLAAVLVAIPVLLTADTIARVFQERTGNLVRPLPWSLMLPLVVGLLLCAAGVCISATAIPHAYALVPTALLAAGMMALAARRTGQTGFVWAMLAGIVLAYNFSPVFFKEFALAALKTGATAVREERLPFAFYGLTYLPLLAAMTLAGTALTRRRNTLFAGPVREFSVGLACVLFALAFGHPKAIFPVSVVLTCVFAAQAILFQYRGLLVPGIATFSAAAYGLPVFALSMGEIPLALDRKSFLFGHYETLLVEVFGHRLWLGDMQFICLTGACALLLFPGRIVDALSRNLGVKTPSISEESPRNDSAPALCQSASLLLALALASAWVVQHGIFERDSLQVACGLFLSGMLLIHTLKWLKPGVGEFALGFVVLNGLFYLNTYATSMLSGMSIMTIGLLAFWCASAVLQKKPHYRVSAAFALPLRHVSLLGLTLLLLALLPVLAIGTFYRGLELPWLAGILLVSWAFAAARRRSDATLATLGCVALLGLESAALNAWGGGISVREWLPAIWAGTALAGAAISTRLQRRIVRLRAIASRSPADADFLAPRIDGCQALLTPVKGLSLLLLSLIGVGSLAGFTLSLRLAGLIAVAGLGLFSALTSSRVVRHTALVLLNWQILAGVAGLFAPDLTAIFFLNSPQMPLCCLPVALCASLSFLVSQAICLRVARAAGLGGRDDEDTQWITEIQTTHHALLAFVVGIALGCSLNLRATGLDGVQIAAALLTFAAMIVSQLLSACRLQDERHVNIAQVLVAVAIAYFSLFNLIMFGSGLSLFIVLGVAFTLWTLGQLALRSATTTILSAPCTRTGMALPLVTVGLGIYRHLAYLPGDWLGMNSLALLLAAGFYFWRGIELGGKGLLVVSAAIMNIALALLWNELHWSDPQFFMIPLGMSILALVQLLADEIPEKMHAPLRYCGALTILVSPTFHIVSGSWIHLLTLMAAAVGVTLVSIGLRVRALMYTGTAFLIADLFAMVLRGGIDYPNLLWIGGIALGGSVLALAAVCENHRETLLQKLRSLATELEAWD